MRKRRKVNREWGKTGNAKGGALPAIDDGFLADTDAKYQWFKLNGESHGIEQTPEKKMLYALLLQSLRDLRNKNHRLDVLRWVEDTPTDDITSFDTACRLLNINPGAAKVAILRGISDAKMARSLRSLERENGDSE